MSGTLGSEPLVIWITQVILDNLTVHHQLNDAPSCGRPKTQTSWPPNPEIFFVCKRGLEGGGRKKRVNISLALCDLFWFVCLFFVQMLLRIETKKQRRSTAESRIPPRCVKPIWNKERSRCWKYTHSIFADTHKHQSCKLGLKTQLSLQSCARFLF